MGGCQNYGPFSGLIRHLIFRVPKRDHNFDNYPDGERVKFKTFWPYLRKGELFGLIC